MTAPVNEQVKAEAAKSLLERMGEKTKLVRLFRYNASMKHGVPIDPEKDINITPDETVPEQKAPEQPVPTQNVVQIVKTEPDQPRSGTTTEATQPTGQQGMSDKVKGILQTLAVLGGLGAAAWGGSQLGKSDDAPVKDQTSISKPYYSPYQYLEDTGEHLP